MTILYLILIFASSLILVKGANLTIKSLVKLSRIFHWSHFILSFIFVGISTSLPEIFIALTSGWHKISNLSLGNIIGANIINLSLILGLCAIIAQKIELRVERRNQIFSSLLISFSPILLALDGQLSRFDGFVLLALFIFYSAFLFLKEKQSFVTIASKEQNKHFKKHIFKNFILLFFGLILLIASAEIIISFARLLAINLKLSLLLIGLILVSLGTTLPELAFGLKAVLKREEEFSLGNSLGSIVTNSCLALGLAVIISPVEIINFLTFLIASLFFLLIIILFSIFIKSHHQLSRKEGIFLVLFFIIFLIFQFLTSNNK